MKKRSAEAGVKDRSRRSALKKGAAIGAAIVGAPWVARFANAQGMDIGPSQK